MAGDDRSREKRANPTAAGSLSEVISHEHGVACGVMQRNDDGEEEEEEEMKTDRKKKRMRAACAMSV